MSRTVCSPLTPMALILALFFNLPCAFADDADPAGASLRVEKAVVCRGVENRTPVGIGNVFGSDAGNLYCFTKVTGAVGDTMIIHRWFMNGDLKSSVNLPVRSTSWRTWSSKRIDAGDAGDWMVEVVSGDGEVLATLLFLIQ